MAYVYKITNIINNKIYIGKTEGTIEERWRQHCNDAAKKSLEKRPLYNAINKHGKENFSIEIIEETKNPTEREIYWINFYNSYKGEGYNATAGGDGKKLILYNDDEIIIKYLELHSMVEVAKELKIGVDYISKVLNQNNVEKFNKKTVKEKYSKPVLQIDKKTKEIIKEYPSISEAGRVFANGKDVRTCSGHISQVVNGKRKSAYGYCWILK